MSENGDFTPATKMPTDGQSKCDRSGPNVAANAYFGPWPGSQNRIAACADSNDEPEKSSYKILDDDEVVLIGQARRDLEQLGNLIPKKARFDRQRLEAWRQRLDAYESLQGDADMDKLQQTIDHQRTLLQLLDEKIPLTARTARLRLEEEQAAVAAMQRDLNDVWHRHLRDLVYKIGLAIAVEHTIFTRTQTALTSLLWSSVK